MKKQGKSKKRFTRKSSAVPIILIAAGVLFIVMIVLFALFDNRKVTNQDTIPRVSVAEAKQAFDAQQAVFLDVRVAEAYDASHIPGSVHIPLADLDSQFDRLNPQDWIITYCT